MNTLSPSEALDRLQIDWYPQEIVDDVRAAFRVLEASSQPPLTILSEHKKQLETNPSVNSRIDEMKVRILRMVGRCIGRTAVDWKEIISKVQHPSELIEIEETLGLSIWDKQQAEFIGDENILAARRAVKERFQSFEAFYEWLKPERQKRRRQERRRQEKEEINREPSEQELMPYVTRLAACKKPKDVKAYFQELGLPSNWYLRSSHWQRDEWLKKLWRSQQEQQASICSHVSAALMKDPRFFGSWMLFKGWMEGFKLGNHRNREIAEHYYVQWHDRHVRKINEHDNIRRAIFTSGRDWRNYIFAGKRRMHKPPTTEVWEYVVENLQRYPYEKMSLFEYVDRFPRGRDPHSSDIAPWGEVCAAFDERGRDKRQLKLAQDPQTFELCRALAEVLLEHDELTWHERTHWCKEPYDFERLFRILGIPENRWKEKEWMMTGSQAGIRKGGIKRDLTELVQAIEMRFGTYQDFLAWMENRAPFKVKVFEAVRSCQGFKDFLQLCQRLGIPGDVWKSRNWLMYTSRLPSEEGGIDCDLSVFVEAMEERPEACKLIPDARGYNEFLARTAADITDVHQAMDVIHVFAEQHGISVSELFAPANRQFFSLHPHLLAAAELVCSRKEEAGPHFAPWLNAEFDTSQIRPTVSILPGFPEAVRRAQTPEDFLQIFLAAGVEGEEWKSGYQLQKKKGLASLYHAIRTDPRFKNSYAFFVAWMEGKLPLAFDNEGQAREALQREILRLRETGDWIVEADAGTILPTEWAEIRKPEYLKCNIVVKTVATFLQYEVDKI